MLTITFMLVFAFLSLRAAFIIILDNGSAKKAIDKSKKKDEIITTRYYKTK